MCSLWSFIFFVLLITCSVEGSSNCMTDCDSNGQRPFTKYEELCCSPSSKGRFISITKDDGRSGLVVCPDTIPKWCPGVYISLHAMRYCSQIKLLPQVIII